MMEHTKTVLGNIQTSEGDELLRLRRQYRIMNHDRDAVVAAYNATLNKQQKILKKLRQERSELKERIETSKTTDGDPDAKRIKELLDVNKKLDEELVDARSKLADLNYEINDVAKRVEVLKRDMALKVNAMGIQGDARQHRLTKVENKLETTIKAFCSVLSENKKLRMEIESLLKDRKMFNEHWEKLVNRLDTGKKILMDLIEQSTQVFAQREEWGEKIKFLMLKVRGIQISHEEQLRDLKRELDLQSDLARFMRTKYRKRILVDVMKKEKQKREELKAATEKQLQEYSDTLKQIKEFVGEDDVDKITTQFLKREEENFALFTYVNELNAELEVLAATTDEFKSKIDEQVELNQQRVAKQKDKIGNLESHLNEARREAEEADLELNVMTIQLEKLIKGVGRLFENLHCNKAPIIELLGDNTKINQHNVMLYMSIMETNLHKYLRFSQIPVINN